MIDDHDAKFTAAFDEIFRTEGAEVVRTPLAAPRANAIAERFVGTVRRERLDWLLISGRPHLERVLRCSSTPTTDIARTARLASPPQIPCDQLSVP